MDAFDFEQLCCGLSTFDYCFSVQSADAPKSSLKVANLWIIVSI